MLRKIEYLIPAALEAVDKVLIDKYGVDEIPSGYQSAISGFGTSILQMGLLPTLAVYSASDKERASIDRPCLLQALLYILVHTDGKFPDPDRIPIDQNGKPDTKHLLSTVTAADFPREELKAHLMQAALAFKLAIRTYHLK